MFFFESEYERGRRHERESDGCIGQIIGLVLAIAIVWFVIRLLIRWVIDAIYFILIPVLENYTILFLLTISLLFYGLVGLLTGKKPLVKIWPVSTSIFLLFITYWGYIHQSALRIISGNYIRKDHKSRLAIRGDTIDIWSGKIHLSGICQFRPYISESTIEARIDGLPESEDSKGTFSTSIDNMFGETVYRFKPTEDSLFIYHDNSPIIRYIRLK